MTSQSVIALACTAAVAASQLKCTSPVCRDGGADRGDFEPGASGSSISCQRWRRRSFSGGAEIIAAGQHIRQHSTGDVTGVCVAAAPGSQGAFRRPSWKGGQPDSLGASRSAGLATEPRSCRAGRRRPAHALGHV